MKPVRARLGKCAELPAVLVTALAAALTFFSAAPAKTNDAARLKILAPTSTASIPLLLLAQKDPIGGLDIEVDLFVNHPQALASVLRGDGDLLFTGTSSGWENHLDGGPLVMINTGVWGVSSLVGKDRTIKGFADLKGKRVALPFPGSPLDFQTRAILAKKGIDPERDLTLSYSPFPQTVPMLLMGKVDAAPLPEPLATEVVLNRGLYRLVDYRKAWAEVSGGNERSPQVSLFATRQTALEKNALVVRIVEEWRAATLETAGDPTGAARRFSVPLSLSLPVLEAAVRNTLYEVPSFDENKRMVLQYFEDVKEYLPGRRGGLDSDFFPPWMSGYSCGK